MLIVVRLARIREVLSWVALGIFLILAEISSFVYGIETEPVFGVSWKDVIPFLYAVLTLFYFLATAFGYSHEIPWIWLIAIIAVYMADLFVGQVSYSLQQPYILARLAPNILWPLIWGFDVVLLLNAIDKKREEDNRKT